MRSTLTSLPVILPLCLFLAACADDVDDQKDTTKVVVIPTFENALTVSDQLPDDLTKITISSVALDAPGYIVIRETFEGERFPGASIGVLPVADDASNLVVTLDRAARPGEMLFATLHVEQGGDANSFDFDASPGIDPPALDSTGLPVSIPFSIGLPDASIAASDQSAPDPVWASSVTIDLINSPQREALVALHRSLDDLSAPVGFQKLSDFTSTDVSIALTSPVPHNTTLFAVLHEDLGTPGVFDAGVDVAILDAVMMPITKSFVVTLDPAPGASIMCAPTVTLCTTPFDTLPLTVGLTADHAGQVLIAYTDVEGMPQAFTTPITPDLNSLADVALPSPACATTFTLSLLVDVEGVDPLTASLLPYATDAQGTPAVCDTTFDMEVAAPLVSDLVIDPADTVSLTSTIAGFAAIPSQAAFIALYAVDAQDARAELLGFARQTTRDEALTITLVRPVLLGESIEFAAFVDEGMSEVFEPEGADVAIKDFGDDSRALVSTEVITAIGTSENFLSVQDQTPLPANEIVVQQSVLDGAGLVVVFEDALGQPGAAIGFAPVSNVSRDTIITLDRDTTPGEVLHVALNADNGNMMFDGVMMDPFLLRDAQPIIVQISVLVVP